MFDVLKFKNLNGFSGANIFLATKDNKNWLVRKVANSPEDSVRLKIQAEKQVLFEKENIPFFKVPKILETGEIDNKFYFDMEYIKGPDAVKYLSAADYQSIPEFGNKICDYISYVSSKKIDIQHNNIDELYNKIYLIHNKFNFMDDEIILRLLDKINELKKNLIIKNTLCHGDLTLENMIVDRHQNIWILDFLNSNFNHYWQDVSKLYQDLSGGWYIRNNIIISKCVNDFLGNKIYDFVLKIDPEYEQIHNILMCYNFIRIFPYAKNDEVKNLIKDRIIYFSEKI